MAKELPFFKFEPSEWDNGNIQMCSRESKGLFIEMCSLYWSRLGELPYALALQKLCNGKRDALQELINHEIIGIVGENIAIEFLDEQLEERGQISEKRRESAQKRWKDANAMQMDSKSNANRIEEKRKKEKRKDENGAAKAATLDERKKVFMDKVAQQLPNYGKVMLREFFEYWTEMNEGGKKMRFEMQKVFDISRRLKTWDKNNKFNGNGKTNGIAKVIDQQSKLDELIKAEFAGKGATS